MVHRRREPTGIVDTKEVGAYWECCWYIGDGGLLRLLLVHSRCVSTGIVFRTWVVGGLLRLLLVHRRWGTTGVFVDT